MSSVSSIASAIDQFALSAPLRMAVQSEAKREKRTSNARGASANIELVNDAHFFNGPNKRSSFVMVTIVLAEAHFATELSPP